VIK
jgi:hypothetical protein